MRICIDAGHECYGGNKGISCYGEREEVITFKLAEKLKYMFRQKNIDVVLTRPNLTTTLASSKSQSILKRIEIANKSSCDLFVSLHCGADYSIRHNGTEVQVRCLDSEDEKIAAVIKKSILKKVGTNDRGIRKEKTSFLKNIFAPAILIETAFITNENDVNLLRNCLDDFAKAIFDGVCEYFEIGAGSGCLISEPKEIVEHLSKIIEIDDVPAAVCEIEKAKRKNNLMYWMIYRLVNR